MSVEKVWEYYCETARISNFGIQKYFFYDKDAKQKNLQQIRIDL